MVKRRTGRVGSGRPRGPAENAVAVAVPAVVPEADQPGFAESHPEIQVAPEPTKDETLLRTVSPAAISEKLGIDAHGVPADGDQAEPQAPEPDAAFVPVAPAASDAVQEALPAPSPPALATPHRIEAVAEAVVPKAAAARRTISLAAQPLDIVELNMTLLSFLRGETAAALAHVQSLGNARSPADLIRLQVSEMQRMADASLTCWSTLARKASRLVEARPN